MYFFTLFLEGSFLDFLDVIGKKELYLENMFWADGLLIFWFFS